MINLPQQALPIGEKTAEWRQRSLDAYIEKSNFGISSIRRRDDVVALYDYYNGIIDDADYTYILQPYGKEVKNNSAKIRNFNILKPNIDLLLGEKSKRPLNFNVVVASPDVVTKREEDKKRLIRASLERDFAAMFDNEPPQTDIRKLEMEFERNWKDSRAIQAEHALRYLMHNLEFRSKNRTNWFDFLIAGFMCTYKGARNNDVYYEVLNPANVDYDKDPDINFIEDGQYAVVRRLVHRNSLVDFFYEQLTDEQVKRLQMPLNGSEYLEHVDTNLIDRHEFIEWYTVCWKSLKRIGIYKHIDDYGDELQEIIEEEDYDERIHSGIEWLWVNEVWEGHRIDKDIYVDIGPLKVQRGSLDNPSKCKLPVNGMSYSNRNSANTSLLKIGIPYQLTYNVYKYRLENAIAKSKDLLAMFDINMIPEGWDMDKFMYYVDQTGIAWQDYNKEGVNFSSTQRGAIDLSIRTIQQYVGLLQFIVEEWERVSGITRQRQGQTGAYELKGTTEQSIIQSSHITEDYYSKMSEFERRELQGLLDFSQMAWADGRKGMYIMQDSAQKYFDIDQDYPMTEYGIFLSDSSADTVKLNQIRSLSQAAVQNGAPLSMVVEMIDSDSFSSIREKIKEAELLAQEMDEARRQAEQEMAQMQQQMQQQQIEFQMTESEKDRELQRELKMMDIESRLLQASPAPEDKSFFEERKLQIANRKLEIDREMKERQLRESERANRVGENLEARKIAAMKNRTTTQK